MTEMFQRKKTGAIISHSMMRRQSKTFM